MAKSKSQAHLFSVALDFGTTFSGFAYSTTNDFKERPDQVHAYTSWNAGGQALISSKTPTCLLLTAEKEFEAFGYEAENKYADLALDGLHRDRYYFRRYKMKLHGNKRIKENTMLEDESGKPLPAMLVFSLSIKYLKDKFIELLGTQGIKIMDDEIMWTLTVPAIWSESAKSFMRKAGVEAGIKSKNLKLSLEPEAASLFCQHIPIQKTESGISMTETGTKYMVVDLGGGTVDITVHEKLPPGGTVDITVHEKLPQGKLKEIHKASGGPWGGTAVDEGFTQLLTKIVGGPVMNRLRKEHTAGYLEIMREFEISKRTLDPKTNVTFRVRFPPELSELCENETGESLKSLIQTPNSPYMDQLKVVSDKLIIDRELMIKIFKDVEKNIFDHVRQILRSPKVSNISFILLVGGFAESTMIQHFLRNHLETESRRVLVPQDAGLSVVKGAVIYGHLPSAIDSRIARFSYGHDVLARFNSEIHPESKIEFDEMGEAWCRDVFRTFVTAGTSIRVGEVIKVKLKSFRRESNMLCVYYTEHSDVILTDDKRLTRLYKVYLRDILPVDVETNQEIVLQFSFGETEVETEVQIPETGFKKKISNKFKLE